MSATTVVFFDLGDTLGTPVFSPPPRHLIGFERFDFTLKVLEQLKQKGFRLGVISNSGEDAGATVDRVLEEAGIVHFFEDGLRIYSKDVGKKKDSDEIFILAAEKAHVGTDQCLFVGENATERSFALEARMRVAPHPLLVTEIVEGHVVRYARITVPPQFAGEPWRAALRRERVVPMKVEGPNGTAVFAAASERAVARLINMGFGVELLGDPETADRAELTILRDDRAMDTGFLNAEGEAEWLFATPEKARLVVAGHEGLVVALPGGVTVARPPHFRRTQHGHNEKLVFDPGLLEPPPVDEVPAAALTAVAMEEGLTDSERGELAQLVGAAIAGRVRRYSGADPPAPGEADIPSRHIMHGRNELGQPRAQTTANERAALTAAGEFLAIGQGRLTVRLPGFSHGPISLLNVEAELAGDSSDLVLVTAHLDSTAEETPGNDPASSAAPGADDDASGVAGVLAIAERLVAMTAGKRLPRTIRFVLFNAEEQGLVGSKVYVRQQRAKNAPIAAVFQMDMIGNDKERPSLWEVHAGFEARSLELAYLLHRLSGTVSPDLQLPQIYHRSIAGEDPAEQRSDHYPFQVAGYPACTSSEDLFVGPTAHDPAPEPNRRYHEETDTHEHVNAEYAANIARVVAAGVWILARTASPERAGRPSP